jgi:fused signal recognition particle receptor
VFHFRKPSQPKEEPGVEQAPDSAALEPLVHPPAGPASGAAAIEPVADLSAVVPSADLAVSAPAGPEEAPGDLTEGLQKSRGGFMSRLRGLLRSGPAAADWDSVEEQLIAGDVGGALAAEVVERARTRKDAPTAEAAVREELAGLLIASDPAWRPSRATAAQPAVLLIVGVNGTGKTTTIGKLAHRYRAEGSSVLLAAADTFRAAAIDQLRIWSDRSGCQFVAHAPGADPAAVVYDAIDAAVARHVDIVIADTAGRLHTKSNLMDELAKMRRVIDRRLPGARPEVLFILDATTGQNGLAQAKVFHETVGLTGIVLTKLDSTAKGGIVFAIEDALKVPVRFVGVGEKLGDLLPFDSEAFVGALFA